MRHGAWDYQSGHYTCPRGCVPPLLLPQHGAQCGRLSPNDLPDVGGDEIADELLHVAVDGSALLNSRHDGGEVVVREHHLSS